MQFSATLSHGRILRGRCFRLHYRPADAADAAARLGLTVSRRVDKRATGRNRIKRQGRERFRHWRTALPAGDYVLVAASNAAEASNPVLREDLDHLFGQLSALKPPPAAGTMPPCPPRAPANFLPN